MRGGRTAARLGALTALALAVVAVLVVVRAAVPADGAPAPRSVAPCGEVDLDGLDGRVACRTPSALLTIADQGTPLVVGRTEARVLRSRLDGRVVVVRLRLRPPDASMRRARLGPGQVYLNVGGRRWAHAPVYGGRRPGRPVNVTLRFRLGPDTTSLLRRGKTSADLGVVPAGELGERRPSRLGVIRLDLP